MIGTEWTLVGLVRRCELNGRVVRVEGMRNNRYIVKFVNNGDKHGGEHRVPAHIDHAEALKEKRRRQRELGAECAHRGVLQLKAEQVAYRRKK